jgi:excisionase family DNA binding protein
MTPAGELASRVTVTIAQAAERAQVSRRTIYAWLADGKIQFVRTPGGRVRIFVDTLFRESGPFRAA